MSINNCMSCRLNLNPETSSGGTIRVFDYWILEHIINPIPIVGWLILKTKRHAEGLTELNQDETAELSILLDCIPKVLKKVTNAEMVYSVVFTEEVKHFHMHIIPRRKDETLKGYELFSLIDKVKSDVSLSKNPKDAVILSNKLKTELDKIC